MDLLSLQNLSYGVYVVASRSGEKLNGQIANSVFQVTSQPPQITACINKENLTHKFISESGLFSVTILSEEAPMAFIGKFGFKSGKDTDKFHDVKFKMGITSVPITLDYSVSYLECKMINSLDAGTHTLFVGEVVAAEKVSDGKPMTYAFYHEVKKGKAPKTAPTYSAASDG